MAKRFLTSLVDIRPGEGVPTLLMVLYHYLLLVTLYFLEPAADSLFLVELGAEQLPFVFILIAAIAFPITSIYAKLSRAWKLNRLINATTVLLIASLILLRLLLGWQQSWVYYVFFIWVSIFGILATSQFWLLANAVFDAAQAKRLFVLLSLGAILGAFTGGEVASLFVRTLGVQTRDLLFFCMGFLAICVLLVNAIWRLRAEDERSARPVLVPERAASNQFSDMLGLLRRSRHLLLIVCIIAWMMMTVTFVDYQFMTVSVEAFPETQELTAFLGKFYGRISLVALLVQLLFTYRLLRVLGVGGIILFLPIGLLVGSIAMLAAPGLWAGIVLRGFDKSFKHSVDKTGRELLFLPVPLDVQKRIKVFIDLFVDRLFRGIAGVLLLIAVVWLGLGTRELSIVVIVLLVAWIATAVTARSEYIDSFRRALERREIDLSELRMDVVEASTIDALVDSLSSDNERQVLYALEMLESVRDARLERPVRALLAHPSPAVRRLSVRALQSNTGPSLEADIAALLEDPDMQVRIEAMLVLSTHPEFADRHALERYLKHDDRSLRAAAVGSLALLDDGRTLELLEDDLLQELLEWEGPEGTEYRVQVARALGRLDSPIAKGHVRRLLEDPEPVVVREAITSAGLLQDGVFVEHLLLLLADRRYRASARRALSEYGTPLLATLDRWLGDESVDPVVRSMIPRVVSEISDQRSVDLLTSILLRIQPDLKPYVLDALGRLKARNLDLRFDGERLDHMLLEETKAYYQIQQIVQIQRNGKRQAAGALLQRALSEQQDQNLAHIFQILGLSYASRDIHSAYLGVTSENRRLRANAVEFLDNLLRSDVKKFVLPLVEHRSGPVLTRLGAELFGIGIGSSSDAFRYLIGGRNDWLRACAIRSVDLQEDPGLSPLIRDAASDPDPVVRETAQLVLRTADGKPASRDELHAAPMVVVDKVTSLQSVDVFKEVLTEQVAFLAHVAEQRAYAAGEPIFLSGDPPDALYLLLEGEVRLYRGALEIARVHPGEAFGTWAIFDSAPRVATAECTQAVTTLRISRAAFFDVLADHPSISERILTTAVNRVERLLDFVGRQQQATTESGARPGR